MLRLHHCRLPTCLSVRSFSFIQYLILMKLNWSQELYTKDFSTGDTSAQKKKF